LKLLLRREGLGEADWAERRIGFSVWTKHRLQRRSLSSRLGDPSKKLAVGKADRYLTSF